MAQRRLFSQKIVGSDAFLDMPTSSRELYFQLGMYADDDGFINPKKIIRMVGAAEDDLRVLITKRFVLPFDNGIIVIKHWFIHNTILKDRYLPTMYSEQKKLLKIKDNGAYTETEKPNVIKMITQVKLSKDKLSKDNESSPSFEGVRDLVNYFFELKGWANKEKSFYKEKDIRYAHHAKRAKELLDLCEGDVLEAKECMRKMSEWATSRELTWTVETIFKHWYDIDLLKPKEKKPYWDNCRIFQKSAGGRWWIIRNGEIKELGRELKQEEISWK